MEYLFIYLLQLTDIINAIKTVFIGLLLIFGFFYIFVIVAIISESPDPEPEEEIKLFMTSSIGKILYKGFTLSLIFLFLSVIIPTKQTLLLMGGTYYGKRAISTVITNGKLEKVNKIIDLQLDNLIKDYNNGISKR